MMQQRQLLNDDGVSINGCKMIYAPKGQAGEYAPLAANPYRGCGHGCSYCYVPLITKQDRKDFDAGAVSRTDYLRQLTNDARKYQAAGITSQVMLNAPRFQLRIEHAFVCDLHFARLGYRLQRAQLAFVRLDLALRLRHEPTGCALSYLGRLQHSTLHAFLRQRDRLNPICMTIRNSSVQECDATDDK